MDYITDIEIKPEDLRADSARPFFPDLPALPDAPQPPEGFRFHDDCQVHDGGPVDDGQVIELGRFIGDDSVVFLPRRAFLTGRVDETGHDDDEPRMQILAVQVPAETWLRGADNLRVRVKNSSGKPLIVSFDVMGRRAVKVNAPGNKE